MPITFSITLDVDEELARFFENLKTGQVSAVTATKPQKKQRAAASPAKQKPLKKAAPVKPLKKSIKASAPVERTGRKPSMLAPAIAKAVADLSKKGSPFRASDVVKLVMKKNPTLNAGSVTTGVSNHLKKANLKSEQVKDAIGRPYRLYRA